VDELHRHRDLRLYRTWAGKLDKREGAQLAGISTAGEPGSEFELAREQIRHGAHERSVRPGYVRAASPGVVLHEYALPEGAETDDMAQVKLANPFSGITLATLKRKYGQPTMTASHWLRLTCNRAARGAAAGVNEEEWLAAGVDVPIPEGVPVWAGLDVAWRQDTTALVPLWIRDREWRQFGAASVLDPPRDGTSLNPDLVEDALVTLHARNPIATLVMDTTRAEQLAVWAAREFGCEVVDRAQTNALAALDYKRWVEAMSAGWLHHSNDPALNRHVLNAVVRRLPNDQLRFDRPTESRTAPELQWRRVIDGLTAASMCHGVAAAEFLAEEEIHEEAHFAWA
jgi:phage terminase large subunit-like protein